MIVEIHSNLKVHDQYNGFDKITIQAGNKDIQVHSNNLDELIKVLELFKKIKESK